MRRLIVLGSTGSIGEQTLEVVGHLNGRGAQVAEEQIEIASARDSAGDTRQGGAGTACTPAAAWGGGPVEIVGLAAGRRGDRLIEQARRFEVGAVAIRDESQVEKVRSALPGVRVYGGPEAALELVQQIEATDLSAAVVGSAGLSATLAGVRRGMRIGLANKETLVAAGELVVPLVAKNGASLIPVDSEHSAVYQCLQGRSAADQASGGAVKRVVLTASGGPFRKATKQQMMEATVEEALRHPTWQMGPKITIDSATLMNKALEVIEAHWLFGLPGSKIDVIVHPQSFVHSFVEFEDRSILAQVGPPDMRTPIQYALTYPDRPGGCSNAMDWTTLTMLEFEPPDHDKFHSLGLAYRVIEAGGTSGAVMNAANEAAVEAFLGGKVRFGRIVELVEEAMDAIVPVPVDSLDTVMGADGQARAFVRGRVGSGV